MLLFMLLLFWLLFLMFLLLFLMLLVFMLLLKLLIFTDLLRSVKNLRNLIYLYILKIDLWRDVCIHRKILLIGMMLIADRLIEFNCILIRYSISLWIKFFRRLPKIIPNPTIIPTIPIVLPHRVLSLELLPIKFLRTLVTGFSLRKHLSKNVDILLGICLLFWVLVLSAGSRCDLCD